MPTAPIATHGRGAEAGARETVTLANHTASPYASEHLYTYEPLSGHTALPLRGHYCMPPLGMARWQVLLSPLKYRSPTRRLHALADMSCTIASFSFFIAALTDGRNGKCSWRICLYLVALLCTRQHPSTCSVKVVLGNEFGRWLGRVSTDEKVIGQRLDLLFDVHQVKSIRFLCPAGRLNGEMSLLRVLPLCHAIAAARNNAQPVLTQGSQGNRGPGPEASARQTSHRTRQRRDCSKRPSLRSTA